MSASGSHTSVTDPTSRSTDRQATAPATRAATSPAARAVPSPRPTTGPEREPSPSTSSPAPVPAAAPSAISPAAVSSAARPAAAAAGATTSNPAFSHKQILEIVWALLLCLFVSSLSGTVVGTALPTIVGDLGGQDQLAWVASATLLTTTVSTPLWGKISDLYGRKPLMQAAIAVFVVTSALAGLSQTMGEMIAARAGQGVGAGGLMALSQAIMADIVSPRERGRYSGYLGASFGVATVAGPLIGGFLVDGPGWRWCFYVGIPIAVVASVVLQKTLDLPRERRETRIDWLGATVITGSVTSLLLLASLGGKEFDWVSGWSLLLAALAVAGLVAAVLVERRAAEPILPPGLFRNPTFNLTGAAGFFTGFAMFGAMIYLPQYLQVVRGQSPTASGLLTFPLVVGMLSVSVLSGRAITKWGRWKVFPLVGLALVGIGTALLATLRVDTPMVAVCGYMLVFGAGLGFTMQVLILAVQNTSERRDLGIATSASTFFRSMGGAVGVAVFGAVLSSRLTSAIPELLAEHGVRARPTGDSLTPHLGTPAEIARLSEPLRSVVREGFTLGLDRIYLLAVPLVVLAFLAVLAVREVPLRGRGPDAGPDAAHQGAARGRHQA
ncbi:drug resistance transporter, EmrB/QacA subfamily [Actinopolymorpha singaporensis]|uniref:Drug resistance transporter, EmrB/QacA subfamily n=1 Tax=Actinopolymorpha singaporensis TaxID=117157 RepID=A0A1H1YAD4_9ACTN|nr:drug resistance transporter, EmrB/QacA subfamily [Actinopolymorpha singaporensis]